MSLLSPTKSKHVANVIYASNHPEKGEEEEEEDTRHETRTGHYNQLMDGVSDVHFKSFPSPTNQRRS